MLVGLGRGSAAGSLLSYVLDITQIDPIKYAAGSLLSYVLDITQIDPIKYNLQFERFLTKGGTGYPDIGR
jgi:DNA polymerase III alpha subunit